MAGSKPEVVLLLVAGVVTWVSCQGKPSQGAPAASTPATTDEEAPPSMGLAFPGEPPPEVDPAEVPGPEGPFVEPPLETRPREIFHVVAGGAKDLGQAEILVRQLSRLQAVPVGYPAVDQALGLTEGATGWAVVAGKFARRAYAEALAKVLAGAGFEQARVVPRAYRHDRFVPAPNAADSVKCAVVFSGLPGVEIPLLSQPAQDALGALGMLKDGALVKAAGRKETAEGVWVRVESEERSGFLPASRVLLEHNLFPSPSGGQAVLGVPLGCPQGRCLWDYWLVGPRFAPRKLLAPAAERLPHAFSPDGQTLAYSSPGRQLMLISGEQDLDLSLGPGTSPAWSPDGKRLVFRRPGSGSARDEVVETSPPDWQVRILLDFRGEVAYPRALSLVPPPVDFRDRGARLYTLFYRRVQKEGKVDIQRWKVLFDLQGKITHQTGERLTE